MGKSEVNQHKSYICESEQEDIFPSGVGSNYSIYKHFARKEGKTQKFARCNHGFEGKEQLIRGKIKALT
jgi:hypothetical protein